MNLPPPVFTSGEAAKTGRLLLFAGGLLRKRGLFFYLVGAAGFELFLRGFLLVRFRRSVTHNIAFVLCVDSPAA
jgi:hypothetical protein